HRGGLLGGALGTLPQGPGPVVLLGVPVKGRGPRVVKEALIGRGGAASLLGEVLLGPAGLLLRVLAGPGERIGLGHGLLEGLFRYLVTGPIGRVRFRGLFLRDGVHHGAGVLVLAYGAYSHVTLVPLCDA